jgi:ribosomal-protein-alanine N-acetyltransferase
MKGLTITQATIKDLENLYRLEQTCFTTDKLFKSQFKHFIQSPTAIVLVAKHQRNLIGNIIVLLRKNSLIARLYSLAVLPDFQRHGIASDLCKKAEKLLKRRKIKEIRLEVRKNNASAIRFYTKRDYYIIGKYKKFYEDDEDAIRMQKTLTNNMKRK